MEDKNYLWALKYGLILQKPGILSLVVDHSLQPYLAVMALEVMKYDFELSGHNIVKAADGDGLRLLTENGGQIPVRWFNIHSTIGQASSGSAQQ